MEKNQAQAKTTVQDVIDVLFLELVKCNVPEPHRGICSRMNADNIDHRYYWGPKEDPIVFIEPSSRPDIGLIYVSSCGRTSSPRIAAEIIIQRLYMAIRDGVDDVVTPEQSKSHGFYLFRRALVIANRQQQDAILRRDLVISTLRQPLTSSPEPLDQRSLDRLYHPWTMLNWADQGM